MEIIAFHRQRRLTDHHIPRRRDDDVATAEANTSASVADPDFQAVAEVPGGRYTAHNHRHRECSMQKQTFAPTYNVRFTLTADIQHGQRHVGVGQKRTLERPLVSQ